MSTTAAINVVERWDDADTEMFRKGSEGTASEDITMASGEGKVRLDSRIEGIDQGGTGRLYWMFDQPPTLANDTIALIVRVKNGSKKNVQGLRLTMGRRLKLTTPIDPRSSHAHSKAAPVITSIIHAQQYRGKEYEVGPYEEREMRLDFHIPNEEGCRSVRKGKTFNLDIFLRVQVECGFLAKELFVEFRLFVAHPLSLPTTVHDEFAARQRQSQPQLDYLPLSRSPSYQQSFSPQEFVPYETTYDDPPHPSPYLPFPNYYSSPSDEPYYPPLPPSPSYPTLPPSSSYSDFTHHHHQSVASNPYESSVTADYYYAPQEPWPSSDEAQYPLSDGYDHYIDPAPYIAPAPLDYSPNLIRSISPAPRISSILLNDENNAYDGVMEDDSSSDEYDLNDRAHGGRSSHEGIVSRGTSLTPSSSFNSSLHRIKSPPQAPSAKYHTSSTSSPEMQEEEAVLETNDETNEPNSIRLTSLPILPSQVVDLTRTRLERSGKDDTSTKRLEELVNAVEEGNYDLERMNKSSGSNGSKGGMMRAQDIFAQPEPSHSPIKRSPSVSPGGIGLTSLETRLATTTLQSSSTSSLSPLSSPSKNQSELQGMRKGGALRAKSISRTKSMNVSSRSGGRVTPVVSSSTPTPVVFSLIPAPAPTPTPDPLPIPAPPPRSTTLPTWLTSSSSDLTTTATTKAQRRTTIDFVRKAPIAPLSFSSSSSLIPTPIAIPTSMSFDSIASVSVSKPPVSTPLARTSLLSNTQKSTTTSSPPLPSPSSPPIKPYSSSSLRGGRGGKVSELLKQWSETNGSEDAKGNGAGEMSSSVSVSVDSFGKGKVSVEVEPKSSRNEGHGVLGATNGRERLSGGAGAGTGAGETKKASGMVRSLLGRFS